MVGSVEYDKQWTGNLVDVEGWQLVGIDRNMQLNFTRSPYKHMEDMTA